MCFDGCKNFRMLKKSEIRSFACFCMRNYREKYFEH
jgi:hypothetical protein